MSHFTTIQTQVRDIAALRDACQELGLQVVESADARGYAGICRISRARACQRIRRRATRPWHRVT